MILPSSRWNQSGERVPFDVEVSLEPLRGCSLGRLELGMIDARRRLAEQRREVVADRVRQHEVAVGEALHQRRRTERLAPWSLKLASPAEYSPGTVVINS